MSRKCPENVPLSIDALISAGGGILLQRVVGRPEGLPTPIVQNPAGDLSGGAPQLIRLVYRPELYGGCPMEGRGRVPEKVVEGHPAGRLSRQLPPYPGYAQRVGAAASAEASLLVELLNADHHLYGPTTGLDLLRPQERKPSSISTSPMPGKG